MFLTDKLTDKPNFIILMNFNNFNSYSKIMSLLLLIVYFFSLNVFLIVYSKRAEKTRVVVSLTTSPKRMKSVSKPLKSLLNQEIQPDIVQINLPFVFLRTNQTYLPFENYPFLNDSRIRVHR